MATISYRNGSYNGKVKQNYPHGKGVLVWNGNRYEGDFYNGRFHGRAKSPGLVATDTTETGLMTMHTAGVYISGLAAQNTKATGKTTIAPARAY